MPHIKYRNHKTFKNQADANACVEKLQKQFPDRTFTVRKRTFYGKLKTRYTVRSV